METKPLAGIDLETTGTDLAKDRIVSIAIVKTFPDGREHSLSQLINPGIPIPLEATAVHGIADCMVQDQPRFREVASRILFELNGCDLLGFNLLNFDVPLLAEEFHRAGIEWNLDGVRIIDCCQIFRTKEPRDLAAAMKFYCGKEHAEAHDATGDVRATLAVFAGQLERYQDLREMDRSALHRFCCPDNRIDLAGKFLRREGDGVALYNFGSQKGTAVVDDPSLARWLLTKDFPENTKAVARLLIQASARR